MHYVKLLELIAIEKHHEQTYLHIRCSSEQQSDFFWEIDNLTAASISPLFQCDGNYKYRISFYTTYDVATNQFVGSLTKTYRDNSERITFNCSAEYKNCLDLIKSKSMGEIYHFPFIFESIPVSVAPDEIEEELPQYKKPKQAAIKIAGLKTTLRWLVAVVGVMWIIIAASSDRLADQATSAVAIASQPEEIDVIPASIMTEHVVHAVTATELTVEEDAATQSDYPSFQLEDPLSYSIPKGYVALTFDDGPSKYTTAIVDILMQYNVGGTFFFLGANAKKRPEDVRYVLNSGYSIGSHSMNHSVLPELSSKEQEEDLLQSSKAIEEITKQKITLFRPPYGAINEQLTDLLLDYQYKVVLWNKDTEDWKSHDSDKIFSYVRDNEASGSIILFHESQSVVDALPNIIKNLQKQDLKIVSLQ